MGGKILRDKKRENKSIKNVFFHTRRKNYVLASPKMKFLLLSLMKLKSID